jgi:hypothetical protein
MAITVCSVNTAIGDKIRRANDTKFQVLAYTADASGCESLLAAQGAGTYIVIGRITVNAGADITVTIGAGETGGAVTAALIGPLSLTDGSCWHHEFEHPLQMAANTALTVDSSGAGAVAIVVEGYVI